MSNRHAESAATSTANRDRPFDPKVVERAAALVADYEICVKRDRRGYIGTVAKLPTVFGFGTSEAAALSDARLHLKWALAYLIEAGRIS